MQGGSVVKPLVGVANDGPSDAAVLRPVLGSRRGVVIACGMNPRYGDFDPYHMAASAIDEAVRNCVAVGADPTRIAILDNFCWGDCERPETLGSLVRAALACHDCRSPSARRSSAARTASTTNSASPTPSGKRQTIAIPPTLLISAMGQIADVAKCVTMDLKVAGQSAVPRRRDEERAGRLALRAGAVASMADKCRRSIPSTPSRTFAACTAAIDAGLVRACHDLSEGGLAVAAAEMAFAGGLGDVDRCG